MKRLSVLWATLIAFLLAVPASAQKVEYLTVSPLASKVKGRYQPWRGGPATVTGLTWGGDMATLHGIRKGFFKDEGLNVTFQLQNDPALQAQDWVDGKIPMFRGTISQACMAAEAMVNAGGKPMILVQLTYSEGGDRFVWLTQFKQPRDLKGTTGVMQLYAPHAELFAKALKDAGLRPKDLNIRYVREITVPTTDTKGKVIDPATAFQVDSSNQWAMLISPDADRLTGKSAEARPGARPGLSSKEANKVIADVWVVDEGAFASQQKFYYGFLRAFFRAQEDLEGQKQTKGTDYNDALVDAAGTLLGDPKMTADAEGLLLDCRQMGFVGNLAFLTGAGTKRTAAALIEEYQPLLIEMGFMSKKVPIGVAKLDFNQLKKGLKFVEEPMTPEIEYDPLAAARYVEGRIKESASFDDDPNTKFKTEIYFGVDQYDFDEKQYAGDFDAFIQIAQSYGGLQMVVMGYADPGPVNVLIRNGAPDQKVNDAKRQFKNLSLQRARRVIDATIEYAKKHGINLVAEQFVPTGMGVDSPKFPTPRTREEWSQNRRVVIMAQAVSESKEFNPEDYAK